MRLLYRMKKRRYNEDMAGERLYELRNECGGVNGNE